MTIWTFIALVVGIVGLIGGAELLVKGAATIATRLGIAPVVVGLTVVAFGTSAPEFAVSIGASLNGNTELSLGNVVGSNTANVLLILGMSATVSGLIVTQRIIRFDIPLMLLVSFVVFFLSFNNKIGRAEGAVLFVALLVYTFWLIQNARNDKPEVLEEYSESVEELEDDVVDRPWIVLVALMIAGLAALVVGSTLLVNSAKDIAESFGVSDLVIGLTVVAIGTSLPELATSVLAALRGQRDIAVGNVVGSNVFNLLGVLGLSGFISSNGIPVADGALRLDLPVMIVSSLVLIPVCWNGFMIKRWEGFLMMAYYIAYVAYLVFRANESDAADFMRTAALIVVPLTLVTFSVTGFQGWRRHRASIAATAHSSNGP
jgi:cation:H+ antiporter